MAETCAVCGKKMGGLLGLASADETELQKYRAMGQEIPTPICHTCSLPFKQKAKTELNIQERVPGTPVEVPDIPIYTFNPFPQPDYMNLGIVTAHVALGTGPLTALLSSLKDVQGIESPEYNAKMEQASQSCLNKLKIKAGELGASSVIGVQVSFTELTAGHGMLMVCMSGTAVRRAQSHDNV